MIASLRARRRSGARGRSSRAATATTAATTATATPLGSDEAVLRNLPPDGPADLHNWLVAFTGLRLARRPACAGHTTPFAVMASHFFDRPALTLTHGPRGGGKSLGAALLTHCTNRWSGEVWGAPHAVKILGGSLAQSRQVYEALDEFIYNGGGEYGSDADAIADLLATSASYRNGSSVSVLPASRRSVRGPHVPSLILDEVDEIPDQLRQDAMGMCMARGGIPASVSMMSTWHNVDGPMGALVEQAREGAFPYHHFCIFDVLERCPESRSGRWVGGEDGYEDCPACPIRRWCHADRDPALDRGPGDPSSWVAHGATGEGTAFGQPKAKRANGHYAIDSLVQKVRGGVSTRTFESDYLCMGPRAEGLFYPQFDEAIHVGRPDDTGYDPKYPAYLAIDAGTSYHTAAVWFQVRPGPTDPIVDPYPGIRSLPMPGRPGYGATPPPPVVTVFADFYCDRQGMFAEANAKAIIERSRVLCGDAAEAVYVDPASGHHTAIGPVVFGIYAREFGERRTSYWPGGRVLDGIALVESFLLAADGSVGLTVHPRCGHLIGAFKNYRRKRVNGVYRDEPPDGEQHPSEDLMDALRGGLKARFPGGRGPEPAPHARVSARSIF